MKFLHLNRPPREPHLRKKALDAYFLVDDIMHSTITKSADAIEKRTGISRAKMAEVSVMGGYFIMLAETFRKPSLISGVTALMFPIFYFMYRELISYEAGRLAPDGTKSGENEVLVKTRLPFLAGGIAIGSALGIGIGVAFYLLTASNGLYEKAKDAIKASFIRPHTEAK